MPKCDNLINTVIYLISDNGARQDVSWYYSLIGSHVRAFDWYQNQ